jgi:hypothetical protein
MGIAEQAAVEIGLAQLARLAVRLVDARVRSKRSVINLGAQANSL